ncbi:MAG TPA: hypothetical protein VFV94_04855 [Polyangiaceae bacterium]|nr:hypothetical protein [Polyangiaceae bacterium]
MSMLRLGFVFVLAVAGGACAGDGGDGGDHCNREGCDALETSARQTGRTGISGFVAEESDVVANGCRTCPFALEHISFARVGETDRLVVPGTEVTAFANGQYSQELEPGTYSVCVREACTEVVVRDGHLTTLNIRLQAQGSTAFAPLG